MCISIVLSSLIAIPITSYADSGSCGNSLTWTYDNNTKTLTISGTGYMYNFEKSDYNETSNTSAPWEKYSNSMKKLIVSQGVINIGNNAFYNCNSLASILISNGTTTNIGADAFRDCKKLTDITLGNSITIIGTNAFRNCISLQNISIPDSLISIQSGAFQDCKGLTSITIHDSVIDIGNFAFFGCINLKNAIIGNNVERIGVCAFENCRNLLTISISHNIERIGNSAFRACNNLKNVYYAGSKEDWKNINIENLNESLLEAKIHYNSYSNVKCNTDLADDLRLDFSYSDDFFINTSGYDYNIDLARLSLALELSAFTAKGAKTPEERYVDIKHAYELMGIDDESGFVAYVNYDKDLNDSSDKAAYSIATKTLADGSDLIIVVLRGGGYGAEWASNFHVGNGDLHIGFKTPANSVYSTLAAIIENRNIDTKNAKIWITGYSRGAAIANIVSGMINNNNLIEHDNLYSYLFAVPSGVVVNNQDSRNPKHNNIFNMILPYDVVPKVVMESWGYGRYGIDMYVKNRNSYSNNKNEQYFKRISSKPYSVGKAQTKAGNAAINALADIAGNKSNYVSVYQKLFCNAVEGIMCHKEELNGFIKKKYSSNPRYQSAIQFAYQECIFLLEKESTHKTLASFKLSTDDIWKYLYPILIMSYIENVEDKLSDILNIKFGNMIDLLVQIKKINTVADAHNPEYYISWLFGYDNPKDIFEKNSYKAITVSCPVNVSVYDKDNLIAKIVNHQVIVDEMPVEIMGESIKVYIPTDREIEDYNIEISAYDDGFVDYSVLEYNDYTQTRQVNYKNIIVKNGASLCGKIPSEFGCEASEYNLSDNKTIINFNEDLNKYELGTLSINIDVYGNGKVSDVNSLTKGEVVTLTAIPDENAEFLGWYDENENLLSDNIDYSFVANSDLNLMAKFSDMLRLDINNSPIIKDSELRIHAKLSHTEGYTGKIYYGIYDENGTLIYCNCRKLDENSSELIINDTLELDLLNNTPYSVRFFLWEDNLIPLINSEKTYVINFEQ